MKRLLFLNFLLAVIMSLLATTLAQASVTISTANFPDDNFRAAVATAAGVSVGSSFNEANLTTLDLPSLGVTNVTSLKGLELLTGLTYLDISDNSSLSTGANITTLGALVTLKASNCNIRTILATTETYSEKTYAGLTIGSGNASIKYLDLSHNERFYYSGNLKYLTNLETLLLNNCTYYDYWGADPGIAMSSLKWVDVSNCPIMDRIFLPNARSLKHLNASGTALKGFSSTASTSAPTQYYIALPSNLTTLEYLNLADCSSLNSFRAIKDTYNITSLDTLILTNDIHLGWSNHGIEAQTGMTYLDVTNCNISTAGPDYIPNFDNLKSLETLLYGENPNVGYLRLNGCNSVKTLDLHDDTSLTMLALDNCGLPRTNLTINDNNCPNFTGLKLNNNSYSSVAEAMGNAATWGLENIKFLYLENNSGFTGGPLTLGENDCLGLTGLDLSNNGFTSFSAPYLPQSLTALMIGKNPSMTRLEMHNNPGIVKMAADTVMSDGSGLYLLGNTALTYMDISGTADQPNYFQRIGNNNSFNGVPIDTLKASYNKFYTFRNLTTVTGGRYEVCRRSNYAYSISDTLPSVRYYYSAFWPTMAACPDSASVEQLTGLKYLDLSHCQLKDSVYLHKNTELRYLDVSHNRTIKRYTSSQDKGAGYRASIPAYNTFNRDYPDYKKYLWLVDTQLRYPGRQEAYDQEYYTLDYNDTTGLYILDLMDNDKLEYLDVSYTGIQQTALTHCHVSNARFMWIQDLHNLKYLYADYNGMRSMGIGTLNGKHHQEALRSLERLSVIGMRGADITTMQGSMNFLNNNRCPNLHYVNISYSDFDSIGVHNPRIDTLIIKGNPIHHLNVQNVDDITYIDARECAFKQRGYDPETNRTVAIPETITMRFLWTNYNTGQTYDSIQTITMNGARSNGLYSGTVTTPFSGLRTIQAHHRPHLTTLLVNKSNALTDVYCHYNPMLTGITGFDDLAYPKDSVDLALGYGADVDSLNLVWVNDDPSLINLDLHNNINLHYLHAYNDKALGDELGNDGMMLTNNDNLITAWVSNSKLRSFANSAGANLDTLKIWTNPMLAELNVSDNTGLRWLDLRNCRVSELDVNNCSVLEHFDCSNDSIQGMSNNEWGYPIPNAVPNYIGEPGKNSINDLHFAGSSLKYVKADNNDLYCIDGLSNNPQLETLTYSYNHINAINLQGTNIQTYNNTHNGRGRFFGEMSRWKEKNGEDTTIYSMYYLQLKPNAGDGLHGNDTFLGNRFGQDSIRNMADRGLSADGFNPEMVDQFTVNAGGPHIGTRGENQNAPCRTTNYDNYDSSTVPNASQIYGNVAVLDLMNDSGNYIEYTYKDGRTESSTSTFYLVWMPTDEPTDVKETVDDRMGQPFVVSERYYDISGAELNEPTDGGVTIIVRQMSDGTTQTVKVIK